MRMTLGDRIATRLGVLGMSQSELARRVSLRQSSINALVRGETRSSRHLHAIARELKTTVAYLLDETDEPDGTGDVDFHLDSESREVLDRFLGLAPEDRRALLRILRSMSGGENSTASTLHNRQDAYRGRG